MKSRSTRTVLLTGFEAFGGESINPAWAAVSALANTKIEKHTIQSQLLPCVFQESLKVLEQAIAQYQPKLVICVGQAGGRPDITPERIAINQDDARIPDNQGQQPIDTPVIAGQPAAFFSTLPIKAVVAALREKGIPASVSNSAGTFVCNHVFYGLMAMQTRYPCVQQAGFVHIPYLPVQAAKNPNQPSMALATMVEGLKEMVAVCLTTKQDLRMTSGTIFG